MNYQIAYPIADHFKASGYTVKSDSSKGSDYLTFTKDSDKYGFKLVIRFSDHDAMTGRSKCADLDYNMNSLLSTYGAVFICAIGVDTDGDITHDDFEFSTKEERNNHLLKTIIIEITKKLDF